MSHPLAVAAASTPAPAAPLALAPGVHVAPWRTADGHPVLLAIGHDGCLATPRPTPVRDPRRLSPIMMRLWEAVEATRRLPRAVVAA